MISLILPYWDRQEAADRALRTLEMYGHMDLEVIVVDDGSGFVVPDVNLNIRVVKLPKKNEAKSPVTCWNVGVQEALGKMVCLSCIEVLHENPVLEQMADALKALGRQGYILAAAWCPEENAWHTHSTVPVPECPEGTGLAFCGMMYRDLYLKAGGWDEEYREGAGYEDRDFIHRMTAVGAKFLIRDDLVVIHPKSGASISWPPEKFARNRALFESKWLKPLTICCVNVGDYLGRGEEYVEKLFDMIERHLPEGSYRYVCLTDKPGSLPNVDYRLVPEGVTGWWAKLYLFKQGLFPEGERCVFFDLDTLVVGQLDEIVRYNGPFATLRDFWRPEGLGPAVILWRAGEHADLWDDWEAMGRPLEGNGDQTWLENHFHTPPDILQDLYPGSFVSYKTHCLHSPPKGTKVICFHGLPRPHEVEGWVPGVWKVGGSSLAEVLAVPNTESEKVGANIRYACSLPYPWLPVKPAHGGRAVIVAGGPSMKRSLQAIQAHNAPVFAVNGVARVLSEAGIQVQYHVILDARPGNVSFVDGKALQYVVSSQCDKAIFDALEGRNVMLFHMHTPEALANIPKTSKVANLLESGSTVGLATVAIAYEFGFRDKHLYGFDSSFEEDHHAYSQPSNDADPVVEASVGDRTFKTTPWMVRQAQEFQKLALDLATLGCRIEVHGDGLLPHVARLMTKQEIAA